MMGTQIAQPTPVYRPGTTARERLGLAVLLLVSLLIRLPAIPPNISGGDANNFAFGALTRNLVAHPPGYFGFVMAGWLVDKVVGDIHVAFVLISEAAALASIVAVYYLARAMGLRWQLALIAGALHSASINLLAVSGMALTHTVESFFATTAALLIFRTLQQRTFGDAIAATLVWAMAGAFRPSTTIYMLPLWLYMLWQLRARRSMVLVLLVVGVVLTAAWELTDRYLLDHASFAVVVPGGQTFALQAFMPSNHEYATFGAPIPNPGGVTRPSYHMPLIEVCAWIEDHVGIHVMPRVDGLPPPSLRRAAILGCLYLAKLGTSLILAQPLVLAIPFLLVFARRRIKPPGPRACRVLVWWIIPGCIFFVVGHLGSPAYLQLFLGGVCVLLTFVVLAGPGGVETDAARAEPIGPVFAKQNLWLLSLPGAMLLFFLFGRPLPPTSTRNRLLNIAVMQNNAWSIRHQVGESRESVVLRPDAKADKQPEIKDMHTDAERLEFWKKTNFSPLPPFWAPRAGGAPAATQPASDGGHRPG